VWQGTCKVLVRYDLVELDCGRSVGVIIELPGYTREDLGRDIVGASSFVAFEGSVGLSDVEFDARVRDSIVI